MQISSSKSSKDDAEEKPIEQDVQEGRTTIGNKSWKSKVENLNVQIVNDDNFV